jgi:hypothetical protein
LTEEEFDITMMSYKLGLFSLISWTQNYVYLLYCGTNRIANYKK